jgi:hypothetical protein
MDRDKLYDFEENIESRSDFLEFMELLIDDLRRNKDEWDNNNLEDFLSAFARFAGDIGGYYNNNGETVDIEIPTWKMIANMMMAAIVYD